MASGQVAYTSRLRKVQKDRDRRFRHTLSAAPSENISGDFLGQRILFQGQQMKRSSCREASQLTDCRLRVAGWQQRERTGIDDSQTVDANHSSW